METSVSHHMYYAAIVCPPEVNEKVLQFKQQMRDRFGCTAALKSPAHITLIPPFWLEKTREQELIKTVASFESSHELTIQLEGFSHFNRKVLFIQVKENPGLFELKKQTEFHFIQSMGNVINPDNRSFHPHITIATRDLKPGDFMLAWEYFSGKKFTGIFNTNTLSLLRLDPAKWNIISEKNWS
jgi:2'-5' RNA ligase